MLVIPSDTENYYIGYCSVWFILFCKNSDTFLLTLCIFFSLYPLQDTQDETAVLWLDEIQDGIHRANKDTEESERCKYYHTILQLIPIIKQVLIT